MVCVIFLKFVLEFIYGAYACVCTRGNAVVHVRKSEGNWWDSVLFLPRESQELNTNHRLGDRRPIC